MTDLTEQWKKGELPEETECYVRVNGGIYLGSIRYKNGCHNKKLPYIKSFNGQFITKHVEEVLAEVPDYVEWKQLKEYERIVTSYNMKPIDYDIACQTVNKLLDDNKRLKHDVGNLGYKIKNQRHEIERQIAQNAQLKELLKECRNSLEEQSNVRKLYESDVEYRDRYNKKMDLLIKIDEVLK